MKKILLFTVMCVLGLFGTLKAQETTFSTDFEDGALTGWRVFKGEYSTSDNWQVAEGKGKDGTYGIYSASCVPMGGGWGAESYPDNYVVTENAYAITETSKLSWYMGNESVYGYPNEDLYYVVLSTDGASFTTVAWSGNGEGNPENEISLAEYAGQTLYIGFHHTLAGAYGDGIISLDNIVLSSEGGNEGGETPDPEEPGEGEGEGEDEGDGPVEIITLGADSETNAPYIPMHCFYEYSLSQQIYTAEEINFMSGNVTKIAFMQKSTAEYTRNLSVFMLNTDRDGFAGWDPETNITDWSEVYSADKVFEGNVTTTEEGQWLEIELQNNFFYEGENILVCIQDNTGSYDSDFNFQTYATDTTRTLAHTRDGASYDLNNISTTYGTAYNEVNTIQFTIEYQEGLNVFPQEISLGNIMLGEYWPEKEAVTANVTVYSAGLTVTEITCDNPFFTLPEIDLTAAPIKFAVGYDKAATAGEYTGTITVNTAEGETAEIALHATTYSPVEPDLFEIATEITFEDNAFTATPDFATLHDDYLLPNETKDNVAPDAVYSFTLEKDEIITVDVDGTNGFYAIYKAESLGNGNGPQADNNYNGVETVLDTAYTCNFDDANVLNEFTTVDLDQYTNYSWGIESGTAISYGYYGWYGDDGSYSYIDEADERLITNEAYTITPMSVLTMDINRADNNTSAHITVELTKDGVEFIEVGYVEITPNYYDDYPEVFEPWEVTKRFDIGAKLVVLGKEYGDYRIAIRHKSSGGGKVIVDNLLLTERAGVFAAGDYYLVAAAQSAFTVSVELMEQEEPEVEPEFDPEALYRLVYTEIDGEPQMVYQYASEKGTTVNVVKDGGLESRIEYTANGQIAKITEAFVYEDENGEAAEDIFGVVTYLYNEQNVWVGWKEEAPNWEPAEFTITYNADNKVETVQTSSQRSTYSYNEEGQLAEVIAYDIYEDGTEEIWTKLNYTYENGRLVKEEWETLDWYTEELVVDEVINFIYDADGNCVKEESYILNDNDELSIYHVVEYKHSKTVAYENVFYFEAPHATMSYPVKPSHANIITKESRHYCYTNEQGEVEEHSFTEEVYNYEAYEAEEIEDEVPAPTNVKAEATSSTTIRLSWDPVPGALAYGILWVDMDMFLGGTYETYVDLTDMEPNTQYCFKVFTISEIDEEGYIVGYSEDSEEACATTWAESVEEATASFNIYPNPVNDVLFIESTETVEEVSIYTIAGVMVYNETSLSNNSINVSELNGGVYIIKVRTENNETISRFVKK